MTCIVNPDGSIYCPDPDADEESVFASFVARANASHKPGPANAEAQAATVRGKLTGTTLVILVDASHL